MELRELIQRLQVLASRADPALQITGIAYDSRKVEKGNLFVAMEGEKADGNAYIQKALEKGARAVVTQVPPEAPIPYILVPCARRALAELSACFFEDPAKKLTMVGVTGTNGKSSVTWILKQVLESCTETRVGLLGTVENRIGDRIFPADHTTPQSPELHSFLAQMVEYGCRYALMEVSSHGLWQQRVAGIPFAVGAFTNLTEDHLDYHGTMERYCQAKAQLFLQCERAVVNGDDPWHQKVLEGSRAAVLRISTQGRGELTAREICLEPKGVSFQAVYQEERIPVWIPIPGSFTVYNGLTALGIALQLGIPLPEAARALKTVQGIKGRMENVPLPGEGPQVIIDYAHTPDGLEKLLQSVRSFCKGKLIVVFGCGGERDRAKRPIMGKIATDLADFAVITSDNPRKEPPNAIILDILQGVQRAKNYIVLENRVQAIGYAMDIGKKDDIIVLSGKGHETYQQLYDRKIAFDEREILRGIAAETR